MDVRDSPTLSHTHTNSGPLFSTVGAGQPEIGQKHASFVVRSLVRSGENSLVFSTHVEAFLSLEVGTTAAGIAYCGTEMEAIGAR
jgi:hypothetical protein